MDIHVLVTSDSSPPTEDPESSVKDTTEPTDQQTDKKLPEPPKPSANDKKSKPASPPKSKEDKTPKKEESKEVAPPSASALPGGRNETRVGLYFYRELLSEFLNLLMSKGENEPHASTHRRTSQTIPERGSFINHLQ